MRLWVRFRSWLQGMLRQSRMENEMDVELRFHMEAYAEDLVAAAFRGKKRCGARGWNLVASRTPRKNVAKRAACTSPKLCCRICAMARARCCAHRDSR